MRKTEFQFSVYPGVELYKFLTELLFDVLDVLLSF